MVSPYTGNPIPLCKLFRGDEYNKEHIVPKQRFFDDSQSNLVIAETAYANVPKLVTIKKAVNNFPVLSNGSTSP